MNTSGRQFFQVDLVTHFLLRQMQIDDDFQLWQWDALRELQSNRFLLLGVLQLSRRPDGHVSAWEQHLQLFSLLPHVNQI